jgi:hypothetical protein
MWARTSIRGFARGVMMSWDDILAQYDHVEVRSFLNGRVRVGYPPSVGSADLDYGRGAILRERDLIGRAVDSVGREWKFALWGMAQAQIFPCPCGQRLVIENLLFDLTDGLKIDEFGLSWFSHGFFSADGMRLFIRNCVEIHCFDHTGLAWKSRGLFEGDINSAEWCDGFVHCKGPMGWVDPDREFSLYLDPATGDVVAGDDEALKVYGGDRVLH